MNAGWRRAIMLSLMLGLGLAARAEEYEIGGPLAGVKIQAEAPDGYGAGFRYRDLYPGSVETYLHYWQKYMPVRPFFDRQSQVKNFLATQVVPAGAKSVESYAEPIYQPRHLNSGKKREPVPVVRTKVKDPIYKLDLGELAPGLYAVRVIGAVETAKNTPLRSPMIVSLKVNDGLKGEINHYKNRIGYVDEFMSVAELYFHAPEKRKYQAEVWLEEGSALDLLVHNISLDDALAGTARRPIKTKMTMETPEEIQKIRWALARKSDPKSLMESYGKDQPLSKDERWAVDAQLWKKLPPPNMQLSGPPHANDMGNIRGLSLGMPGKAMQQMEGEFGKWEAPPREQYLSLSESPGAFLINKKLSLTYSYEDLWAGKPLPAPYPYQDDGPGFFYPDPNDPAKGTGFCPVAEQVYWVARAYADMPSKINLWLQTGEEQFARDAAVRLIRHAYQYPAADDSNTLASLVAEFGPTGGRDYRFRHRRERYYTPQGAPVFCKAYDQLFEYIKGNQDLADSIRRFVPSVKSANDLIALIDSYYVQTQAKDIMRYQFVYDAGMSPTEHAAVLGDNAVTDPWMQWTFARYWKYPNRPDGLQNSMIIMNDRTGASMVGSTSYASAGAMGDANALDTYLAAGGDPKYDLSNPSVYPKPLSQCYWYLELNVAGLEWLRIGDVTGPDKPTGRMIMANKDGIRPGWRWAKDPKFAWMILHLYGREKESDAEWKEIQDAAAKLRRAPYLDLHSRVQENWAAILETGHQHDDYRFRRAAYVRTGMGYGHQHDDSLDLQVVTHGLPMTIDGGQRGGYSKPRDAYTRVHNVVEVDGQGHRAYAHVQTISDAEGARYMQIDGVPPRGAKLFRRQVALIDVDEGEGSQKLSVQQQKPGAKLPADVTTANSYVFDVFRVSGGKLHSYGFHGSVNGPRDKMLPDMFSSNIANRKPVEHVGATKEVANDAQYLSIFEASADSKFAGDAPAILEATWHYQRNGMGSEQTHLQQNFAPQSPAKFTRLHLLDAKGMRALQADAVCTYEPLPYRYTNLMAQRRGQNLESAFAAIIEPYAGEPFITGLRTLSVDANDADALRAVAVEAKTKNGRTDVCFADGRPDKVRQSGPFRFSGEFAYYSTDAQGLRQAALTGGTLLEGPDIRLAVSQRQRTGTVLAVDYLKKTLRFDAAWPAIASGRLFEIGIPGHWRSYISVSMAPQGQETSITVQDGADFFRSQVVSVGQDGQVECAAQPSPIVLGAADGLKSGWVASNDQGTKGWRADLIGGSKLALRGGPVSEADFAPSGALRLWEYGVGDQVRQSTFVSVRRIEAGVYELSGDTDVTIGLKGSKLEVSSDAKQWQALPGKSESAFATAQVQLSKLAGPGVVYVRASK